MQKFIKQSELQAANSQVKLNVLETGIHLATADTDVGFVATATLTKALKEKKLSKLQMYEAEKECCANVGNKCTKIQERGPLNYNFPRKLESLDLGLVVAEPDTAVKMLKQVLTKLVDTKWKANATS